MTDTIAKVGPKEVLMELWLNNQAISQVVTAGRRLIDFLRDDLHLFGTKEGCGEGECGSCTVFLNGTAVLACLIPMEKAIGAQVVTIEGIGTPTSLHPVPQALIEEAGVQCGMCTPGMVMAGVDLLRRNPDPNREEIIEGIAGNL